MKKLILVLSLVLCGVVNAQSATISIPNQPLTITAPCVAPNKWIWTESTLTLTCKATNIVTATTSLCNNFAKVHVVDMKFGVAVPNATIKSAGMGQNDVFVVAFETPAVLPVSKTFNVSLYRNGSDPYFNRHLTLSKTKCDFSGIEGFAKETSKIIKGGYINMQTPPQKYADRVTVLPSTKYYLNIKNEETCKNNCDFFLEFRFPN